MKLSQYMRLYAITEHELARRAGVSQPAINRLRNGRGNWTVGLLYRVSEATDGDVSLADLVATYVPPPKPARRKVKATTPRRGRPPNKQPAKKAAAKQQRAKGKASARASA